MAGQRASRIAKKAARSRAAGQGGWWGGGGVWKRSSRLAGTFAFLLIPQTHTLSPLGTPVVRQTGQTAGGTDDPEILWLHHLMMDRQPTFLPLCLGQKSFQPPTVLASLHACMQVAHLLLAAYAGGREVALCQSGTSLHPLLHDGAASLARLYTYSSRSHFRLYASLQPPSRQLRRRVQSPDDVGRERDARAPRRRRPVRRSREASSTSHLWRAAAAATRR